MQRSVFIVNSDPLYVKMFRSAGWKVLRRDFWAADLIQFTGGADVDPHLYGERPHRSTYFNPMRDARETLVFNRAMELEIPMAGICRGAQFLNVMCGGAMYQHVDGHATIRGHDATDTRTGETFLVSSTHHQMIIPHDDAEVLIVARESTKRTKMKPEKGELTVFEKGHNDVEACFYPWQRCFCFQPHPELNGWEELAVRYFGYLDDLIFHGLSNDQVKEQ